MKAYKEAIMLKDSECDNYLLFYHGATCERVGAHEGGEMEINREEIIRGDLVQPA